ncbi:MAG: dienelactone hydrolase family protein [Acidiferrobacterales bacterium]
MHTIRTLAVLFLGGWLFAGLVSPVAAQWITFSSSPAETLVQSGEPVAAHGSAPVRGYLSVPVEVGRHPAVVMLPSCEGHKAYQQTWARALSERGYVALVVDDYFMQDRGRTCGIRDPAARAELLRMRVQHALGAARYLSAQPEVDRGRMAVMGWGDAPVGALVDDVEALGPRREVFKAAVAVTPTTCDSRGRSSSHPMLVLCAESYGTERGNPCDALADTPALEVRVYAGTLPGFDDPQAGLAEPSNAGTAPRRYDRLAHVRAIEDVTGFLNRRLPPMPSDGEHPYVASPTPAVSEVGTWAVDPYAPGPDLPPAGGSAFDAVFSRATAAGVVHDVPFPFPRLLQMLEHAAGGEAMSRSPLDATLIPLGRSLQREAAAPDYFQSPRVVVAVTGEPESGTGPLDIRLKNRLFLGYQPRASMVEIISYNEAASRFEFQVVRDYGPDRAPRVRYARRALCTSCHQNAGPIFADASWDETTANPRVASRLGGLGVQFHGVPVTDVDRAVVAIDKATNEANLLPVYQRLWSEGCASALPTEAARCRAGALQAMVHYRLSNSAGFERTAALYAEGYLPLQRRNWTRRWPRGLLIPNPNLPNRSPLMSSAPSVVSVALDPLRRRPPMARWEASTASDLDRLVRGLSRSLPERHMGLLARYLREAGEGAPGRSLTAPCTVIRRGFAGRPRLLQIECRTGPKTGAGFHLRAQLRVTPDGSAEGEAGWLEMGGGTYARRTMVGRVEDAQTGSRIALRLVGRDGETAIRAPDGNSLLGFALAWDEGVADSATRFDASGTLSIASDFRPVASTLGHLAAGASASSPLLAERFDGARLSGWLLAEIGVLPASRCCDSRPMPDPRLDVEAGPADAALSVALEHRGLLLTFRRYCGACHGSDTAYPPGFLRGGGDTILGSVAQCAERIYYRLSMWHRPPEYQRVPPMPPAQGLSLAGTTADDWRRSESLERLTAYTRELLVAEGRDPDELLAGSYHATRACLANRDEQRDATAASLSGG